ncbi:ARID/BRIGHT DNA binding domain [Musa troglodytarum]|uniref:ARID/BRIGHT DNA binding domain n=1 Tax=Musa troglodytarum TaxID=320322 RepID=A0A9E7FWH1_9LILI|nr:ARID/BRIGHT DNA binding domain [Musa troglodytarum]
MSGLESSPSVFRYAVVAHGMSCKSAGPDVNIRKRTNTTAMKPIPHSRKHKLLSFLGVPLADANNGNQHKLLPPAPAIQRKSSASSLRAQQIVSLNPLPLKKHGCNRPPVQNWMSCSSRLVPQGGISEFPDAILNAKRLDLYNLYREVVSRGGFYVGNGINWKGQVFSKMLIHTATNRMTDYAKTDGLDYICPPCSMSNYKKSQKMKGKELQLVRYDWRQISSSPLELMVLGDASSGERKTDS